ncbi:MAG: hypothetical protein IPP90_20105 [Gemmatimonadaceae bacterium]|nr:hypothetical protein [Gemmatimonadaceae bacterium]
MRFSRHPRLSRILVLFAAFQLVAPSVAAIADAWRLDQRRAFAHIESESSSSCVVVHAHTCALCSIATGATGTLRPLSCVAAPRKAITLALGATTGAIRRHLSRVASPRAPPALKG